MFWERLRNSDLGWREKDILDNLDHFSRIIDTGEREVFRFFHKDGEHFFDWDYVSERVVG